MKIRNIILTAVLLLAVLTGGISAAESAPITSLDDMADRELTIGSPSDYDVTGEILALCPQAHLETYDDIMIGMNAVSMGKADAYACGKSYIEEALASGNLPDLTYIEEPIKIFRCGLGLGEATALDNYIERVNTFIQQIRDDGTLDDMNKRWFEDGVEDMPELPAVEDPEYTLRIVTYGKAKPYSFVKDGELSGYDVELAYRVAAALNCDVRIEAAEYPAMLLGLATGKYDMISANLYISEERAENIIYSDPYCEMDVVIAVKAVTAKETAGSFIDRILAGLRRTFVEEQRWKMILSGLGVTVVITAFGFLLANILGGVFCACALSKRKFCHALAKVYSQVVQGTPIVVILLLLFYVVFARSTISGVWVAVIGFGLTSGASLAQQFQGAISSVDRGQVEASLALGFTKTGTFFGIILPQSVRRILPGYFSEIIGLMKGTSIVGYIAVIDLTKVSDMIRSSTYDAFSPLIAVALVYFFLAFLLLRLSEALQKKLAPKRVTGQEAAK